MKTVFKNFCIVDSSFDTVGTLVIEDGIITSVKHRKGGHRIKKIFPNAEDSSAKIIDGKNFFSKSNNLPLLMPAFVDLHAHFRDSLSPGELTPSETLESASLAAVAGGYGTVVCMANTKPAIDTIEKAAVIKRRSDALGLIDLYPVLSLTKNLEGKELSGIITLPDSGKHAGFVPLMLSEDGKDIADDVFFLSALREAKRIGVPVSCHCDFGGEKAAEEKLKGLPRSVWSRTEENNAVNRAIELGKKAGCHIHIAHVSTKEAAEFIRLAKAELKSNSINNGFSLTCEAMPHNIALTENDAVKLGEESFGRVNPPLRSEEDRKAIINALKDRTIDAIATDHAPHSITDKEKGVPGFSGLETAFAVCYSTLVRQENFSLSFLSHLMSAAPAGIASLTNRGRIAPGKRADLVVIDPDAAWIVDLTELKTRGKNSPFTGKEFFGKILMTLHKGRIVFER